MPDPCPRVQRPAGGTDFGDPVRWPPQDDRAVGHAGPRLDPRSVHGRHPVVRDHRRHWTEISKHGNGDESKLPAIFQVNWFRRGADGRFLWPGFGENSRVLKWIVERLEGTADAVDTSIG